MIKAKKEINRDSDRENFVVSTLNGLVRKGFSDN